MYVFPTILGEVVVIVIVVVVVTVVVVVIVVEVDVSMSVSQTNKLIFAKTKKGKKPAFCFL